MFFQKKYFIQKWSGIKTTSCAHTKKYIFKIKLWPCNFHQILPIHYDLLDCSRSQKEALWKLREHSLTALVSTLSNSAPCSTELHCHCRLDIWDYSKLWHHLIWLGGNHNHSHCALLYETCHILDVVMRNKLERGKHFCIKFHESFWRVGDEELSTQSPSLLTPATNIAANLLGPGPWQNLLL